MRERSTLNVQLSIGALGADFRRGRCGGGGRRGEVGQGEAAHDALDDVQFGLAVDGGKADGRDQGTLLGGTESVEGGTGFPDPASVLQALITDSGVASRSAICQFGRIIILAMWLRCRKRVIIQQKSSPIGFP